MYTEVLDNAHSIKGVVASSVQIDLTQEQSNI